jgi:hypothetical protein
MSADQLVTEAVGRGNPVVFMDISIAGSLFVVCLSIKSVVIVVVCLL